MIKPKRPTTKQVKTIARRPKTAIGASRTPKSLTSQNTRIAGFPRLNHSDVFPPMQRKQFNWSEFAILTSSPTAGFVGPARSYLLNGLENPTLSGSKPYGYDNFLASTGPYRRYKVLGCKIRITATSAGDPIYLFTQLRNVIDTYSIASDAINDAAEKPMVRSDFVPSSGNQSKIININLRSLAPLFNWDNATFNLDMGQTTAPYNGVPGSIPYLILGVGSQTYTSINLDVKVEIMYDVICYDRETLA